MALVLALAVWSALAFAPVCDAADPDGDPCEEVNR